MHRTTSDGCGSAGRAVITLDVLLFAASGSESVTPNQQRAWPSARAFLEHSFVLPEYLLGSEPGPAAYSQLSGPLRGTLADVLGAHSMIIRQSASVLRFVGGRMWVAWRQMRGAERALVTNAVYRPHLRYLGLSPVTVGMPVRWPMITTMAARPRLAPVYHRCAGRWEGNLRRRFGEASHQYDEWTPRYLLPLQQPTAAEV